MIIKKTIITVLSTFLLLGGYFGYRLFILNNLSSVKAVKGKIISSVYASGKTKAEKEANLSFTSTGRIVYLPVKKNQEVKKNQVLATIDTSDIEANKNLEMQNYLKTKSDYEQIQKDTYKDQVETDTIKRAKEKAQFDLNKSVINVEIANRALMNASLYSPFEGIVTSVTGEINEWTSIFSTKPLITIIDPNSVYFEAELDEENIEKVKVGQEVLITLDAYPERRFEGTISEIEKQAVVKDNGDTVLPIKIVFTTNDSLPLVGLNGDVQFILEKKEGVLVLPKKLVKKKNGSATVTVKDGFTLKMVSVETGVSDAKNIEIIKGITEADKIVLSSELE